MFNKIISMSNSFFGRFKKKDNQVIEKQPPVWEDRIFWVETLQKISFPVLNSLKRDSLRKNMALEAFETESSKFAHLEAFANVFNGIAPWLELGPDESEEGRFRKKYIILTLKAITNAVNPDSNDYMLFTESKQSLMSIALFAQALLRSKIQIWNNLPMDVQAKIIYELKNTRIIAPFENHWLLFTSIIEAALLEFTGECDRERLTYGVRKFRDDWYLGDGIYADGSEFDVSYYNSIFIHPMLNDILKVMRKYSIDEGELLDVQLMRSSRYASQLERIISPEGSYPLLGKSLACRSGIFHLLAQASLFRILPRNIETSQVRSALTKVLKSQFEGHQNFDNNGWLAIGLNGHQVEIAEENINTGSLYGCCAIFLPLGLSFNDSFWVGPFEEWTSLKAWNGNSVEMDQSVDF